MRVLSSLALILSLTSPGLARFYDDSNSDESFYLETQGTGYHGLVSENDQTVNVTPPIKAVGELVCFFEIVRHHRGKSEIPFEIEIHDQQAGTAVLRAKKLLNCEEKQSYQFEIEAVSCSGKYSERVGVHVKVQDINEYSPTWVSKSDIRVEVEEGQILQEILKVEAEDEDCSPKYGDICNYEIESRGQPFEISKEGILSNVAPLNYSVSHSYVLSIAAFDCGMNKSVPLLVTVEVKKPCNNNGWEGLASRLDYIPGTGPQSIFSRAKFSSCVFKEQKCAPKGFEAVIRLETQHIGKGCDRDTYNLESQRQLCGASQRAVDLLMDTEWLRNFGIRDRGQNGDSSMVKLDGMNGAIVPENILSHSNPGHKFTLSTWLKHSSRLDGDKHKKEHIVCKADDHRKNRHHFAVFVRNCKLVLLLREEFREGEENIFRPAEWRWSMPQVCDGEWHHYALNVNFPDVTLIVDGEKWIDESSNPEIIDDWPLHPAKDLTTKITIGACWQGSEGKFKHGLTGYLAGLSVLPEANEHTEVLKCLHQCAESLQVPATVSISPGTEMITNSGQSRVIIQGKDENDISNLIQQIAYLNTREFPAPGKRTAVLSTKVTCSIKDREIILPDQRTDIHVIPVPEPTIKILGTDDFAREYQDFKLGVRIFADVHIVMSTGSSGGGEPVNGIENRLDYCSVRISPSLNPDHEELNVPEHLLRMLNIEGKVSDSGAEFNGAEMIYNYERVLRQVTYTNKKPAYYLNRQFKISCSQLNKRFISNEYLQTLTVIHPSAQSSDDSSLKNAHSSVSRATVIDPKNVNSMFHSHGVEMNEGRVFYRQHNYIHSLVDHPRGNVAAVITVVGVAFFIVLLSMGIVRLRARHKRVSRDDMHGDNEMVWDDSALTITVNPLEEKEKLCSVVGTSLSGGNASVNLVEEGFDDVSEEDESDEDDDGYDQDEESSEEEVEETIVGKERLEWDNNI